MKKIYLTPELEIVNIQATNVIATSPGPSKGAAGVAGDYADAKLLDFDTEDESDEW